jgi:peptidoglycan/LPS O-acetylase OafA/YrhL
VSEPALGSSKRNVALDAARGCAAMLVMWLHMGPMPAAVRVQVGPLAHVHDAVQRVGWVGMDCFFVISGFLVGGLLFAEYARTGRLRVGRFYLRRGLKIWPAFYVLWVFTVVCGGWMGRPVNARTMAAEGLFVQNIVPGMWVHTWSLGLEEQFYLVLPVVLWIGLMVSKKARGAPASIAETAKEWRVTRDAFSWVPWVYVATLVAVIGARVWTVAKFPGWGIYSHYTPTWVRFDELMLGVVCAWWYHCHRASLRRCVGRWRWVFWVIGVAGLSVPVWFLLQSRFVTIAGYTLAAVGFASLMMLMVETGRDQAEPRRAWWVRCLAFVGIHSYSIYVFHQPVRWVGAALIKQFAGREATWWELGALVFPVAVVVGIVLARVIEMPVLALRDRVVPSRSGAMLEK